MPAQTTKIGIFNRGLQLLGQQPMTSVNENSNAGAHMRAAYDPVLLAELRANTWKFAIKRALLSADATLPIFGGRRYFPLPGDFLFLAPEETSFGPPKKRDYEIEGLSIVSSLDSPLEVRFVSSAITEATFDALFAEALAAALAMNTCEAITNSNSKKDDAQRYYDRQVNMARKRNSIESAPVKMPVGSWITARY